jgi:hypothetical protein
VTDGPFLSRWARRKRDAARGSAGADSAAAGAGVGAASASAPVAPTAEARPASPANAPAVSPADVPDASPIARSPSNESPSHDSPSLPGRPVATPAPSEPAPPLPDPQTLTPQSDFTPFMRSDVAPAQRNAALKRLFVDPHFNTMDGLDTYIDDYGRPDPIPPAMLAALQHARALLARDETPPPERAAGDAALCLPPTASHAAEATADARTDVHPGAGDVDASVDTAGDAATQHPGMALGAGLEHASVTVSRDVVRDEPAASTDLEPDTGAPR